MSGPADRGSFVLVVQDPKRGDFANVLAIGELLSERLGADVQAKRLRFRTRFFVPLLKVTLWIGRLLSFEQARRMRRIACLWFFSGPYPGDARPLAVISTLGRGEAQGAFISCFWRVPAIHLGTPKRLSAGYFSAVIAHPGEAPRDSAIPLSLAPTRMRLRHKAATARVDDIHKICLLLGGDAQGVARYDADFWSRCVNAAIETARAHNAALTVSTSPRSGALVETMVEKALASRALQSHELILYGRGDRRDIATEIASADAVLVTAESISMVSDAIASGARVLALYDKNPPASSRVRSFLNGHSQAGTLQLIALAAQERGPLSLDGVQPLTSCWSDILWEKLASLFEDGSGQKAQCAQIKPATALSS